MRQVLERSRYLVLLGVISTLVASAAAFGWGVYKTILVIAGLISARGADAAAAVSLIELMDKFLIAVGLYIFSVGLYELFVGDLVLPDWLTVRSLQDVKSRLSSIIILVMAIVFLEHLVEWADPRATLFYGISVAVVTAALIAFSYLGNRD